MEVFARLSWVDLAVIGVLAAGLFVGFTQGLIRSVLNALAVIVAFVIAAQLKGPIVDLLGFWTAFGPEGRELLVFVLLFIGLIVGGFLVIRSLYGRTRLPIARQLDEAGGAIFGLLFAALLITFHLLVLDSFFRTGGEAGGWLGAYYGAINDSLVIGFFRDALIPTAGLLARPFVPLEIAALIGQ